MKTICLAETDLFNRKKTLVDQILALSPHGGNLALMRQRCRVMDALEKAPAEGPIQLEDADYDVLRAAVEQFPYQVNSREMLALADSVLNPVDPA